MLAAALNCQKKMCSNINKPYMRYARDGAVWKVGVVKPQLGCAGSAPRQRSNHDGDHRLSLSLLQCAVGGPAARHQPAYLRGPLRLLLP